MADVSDIAWCDSTVNLWSGCTRISDGCQNCYAEKLSKRFGVEWGGALKYFTGGLPKIAQYQRGAARFIAKHGRPRRVFINSLSDFFDNQAEPEQQRRACQEFELAENVIFILVTKRPQNVHKIVPPKWMAPGGWPANVWLLVTGENQVEFDRRVAWLMNIPAPVRGVSIEPMLEAIDVTWAIYHRRDDIERQMRLRGIVQKSQRMPRFIAGLNWLIIGGESGRLARRFDVAWANRIVLDAHLSTARVFVKQLGQAEHPETFRDYTSFPRSLQVRHFPA